MAISECELREADILTTNSGQDVPKATIVSPIASSDILKRRAKLDAPSTSKSPPFISNTIPKIINKISIISINTPNN